MDKHWITVQKKTFTNWVNALLEKHEQHQSEGLVVSDLYTDLSDGLKLIRLLEVLTDTRVKTKLHIPAKMKYHKLDNMKTAFDMIFSKKIKLENIGLEDIVDENPKLILGLVWTLISNFSLAKVLVENRSGNDALLFWVQKETQGYPNVDVQNFTTSFQDGLAFCALMHKRVPESIGDFNALKPENKIENLRLAFDAANNWYGIPFLLDPADIASHQPDEKSILTYLSWVYDKLTNDQPFDRRKAEEERQRRLREEAERARKLAEEEEEQRRRLEQLRLQAEEEERLAREREARMRQMEEERKRLEEEAERLRRQREEEEERLRKQREEQERLRKQQEEEERLRRQREEEDRRRREAEEAAKRERERLKQALTQQLQSSVDGEWIIGRTAGGNPDYFTYRINPTYEFKLSNLKPTTHNQPLRFRVTLESRDGGAIFEHAAAAGNRTDNSVGIQVLKLPKDTYELPSVLTSAMTMLNAYAHHQAPANRASLTQQFEIDRASLADLASGAYKLVVVPSTYHPTQGPYRLSIGAAIDSDADLDAVRASQLYGVSLRPEGAETGSLPSPFKTKYYITGRWISGQTSGGMHDLATWRNNPQYVLRIRRTTRFRVVLSQPPTTVNNAKLNSISFDVVRNHDDNITERVLPAHDILASPGVEHKLGKISYKPRAEVALDFTIQYDPQAERDGGMLIFIVPSCWEPEQEGPFLLSILTDQPDLNDIKYVGGAKENSKFEVSVPGEWKGPSAGGPYTAPTWRQNPQFRLRITQPTQLSILLARTDYKFAFDAEAGLSYMEKKHIGICFYVARNRDPTISDQLLPSCQIVKKPKSFIQHSEVAMNLTLDDPNCTYFIVPCTYNPGEECAFKITAFSQTPVHLEPVFRNPNAQVSLRGEWRGRTAGGSTSAPTWRNNPAFRLKLRRPCKISVILQQQVAMTTTTNSSSSSSLQSIGLRVVKNKDQRFDRELVSNYVVVSEAREDDFTYFAKAEISTEVTFPTPHECNDTYFIVPSMFEPGVEGTFALSVVALGGFAVSDVIAEFVPVGGPHYFHTAVRSAWAGPTAGGCRNFNTWKMNPKIGLFVSQPRTLASITLAQDVDPSGMRPLKAISFFIMRNRNPRIDPRDLETFFDPLYGFERLAEVKEGDYIYVAKREVTLEYEFAEPGQYFIVPSTFNAGDECAFTLMCSATAPVDMRAV